MALNDDVLDDLDDKTIVDGDVLKKPGIQLDYPEKVTVIPEGKNTPESTASDADVQKLPEQEVTFQILKDQSKKVIGLQEIEEQILAEEAISRQGAEYVNAAFEGLFTSTLRPEYFTAAPTKTNVGAVRKHMRQSLAKEEAVYSEQFDDFVTKGMMSYVGYLKSLKEVYLPKLLDNHCHLNAYCTDNSERVLQNKNVVVPVANGFVNLLNVSIKDFDPDNITVELSNKESFRNAFKTLQRIFESFNFLSLISSVIKADRSDRSLIRDYNNPVHLDGFISVSKLIEFFKSPYSTQTIESFSAIIDELCKDAEALQEEASQKKGDVKAINEYINNNSEKIQLIMNDCSSLSNIIANLSTLTVSSKTVIEFCNHQ